MAELELRQENILQQLAELKQQLLSIRKELNIKPPTTISNTVQTATKSTVSCVINYKIVLKFHF